VFIYLSCLQVFDTTTFRQLLKITTASNSEDASSARSSPSPEQQQQPQSPKPSTSVGVFVGSSFIDADTLMLWTSQVRYTPLYFFF